MKKVNGIYKSGIVRLTRKSSFKGTYKKNVSKVEDVSPVSETKGTTDREVDNHSLNMRLYAESIREQKEEYKHFYRNEQELEHDLKGIDYHDKDFMAKIRQLIHSYNHTILSLAKFDKSFETDFAEDIIKLMDQYKTDLFDIGIKLLVDGELFVYSGIFEDAAKTRRKDFYFLIGHKNSLFYKVYQLFQKVKIPPVEQDTVDTDQYVGTIIDTKC